MADNKFLKNPGEKDPLLTSKYFHIPGKWTHGIMARRFELKHLFPMHSHEHYELEYLFEGEMTTVIDGVEIPMKPGDFYLLGSGDYHRIDIHTPKVVLLSIFFYHPAADSGIKQFLESSRCPVIGTIPENDRAAFEVLIRQIYETENFSVSGKTDTVSLSALLALHLAYRAKPYAPDGGKNAEGYLQKALHYILANYSDPLTLESVSREMGLSSGYFCRLFSTQMGGSFLDYLTRVRIRKAQNMLIYEPQKSITDIAFEVGFGSYSNFYRAFFRATGISPKDYRDRHKVEISSEQGS